MYKKIKLQKSPLGTSQKDFPKCFLHLHKRRLTSLQEVCILSVTDKCNYAYIGFKLGISIIGQHALWQSCHTPFTWLPRKEFTIQRVSVWIIAFFLRSDRSVIFNISSFLIDEKTFLCDTHTLTVKPVLVTTCLQQPTCLQWPLKLIPCRGKQYYRTCI